MERLKSIADKFQGVCKNISDRNVVILNKTSDLELNIQNILNKNPGFSKVTILEQSNEFVQLRILEVHEKLEETTKP